MQLPGVMYLTSRSVYEAVEGDTLLLPGHLPADRAQPQKESSIHSIQKCHEGEGGLCCRTTVTFLIGLNIFFETFNGSKMDKKREDFIIK